jgi:NAD(P)H-flavin reductase
VAAPLTCTATIRSRHGAAVQRLTLQMPNEFMFQAGQYLEVVHRDGNIPLSIASAPRRLPELHLHYQSTPGVPEAARMDAALAGSDTLTIHGPAGAVHLPQPLPGPALLVAGGTGAAQSMSFIDAFTAVPPDAPVTLLWCADDDADLYLREELAALRAPWLQTVLVADARRSADNHAMSWLRDHGRKFRDADARVIISGGPGFVYAACDALELAGAIGRVQLRPEVTTGLCHAVRRCAGSGSTGKSSSAWESSSLPRSVSPSAAHSRPSSP